ncbi:hypothetical protein LTR86_003679 [Recurvomyces mirabilis]|nr:hypothetical protein LTR86_003679 [Recurvomyces mirabilis]
MQLAQNCHLLDLPLDILQYITRDHLWPDLLVLRGTCQTLHAICTPMISAYYFANRIYMISDRDSIEALRHLSSVNHFARAMRCIRFRYLYDRGGPADATREGRAKRRRRGKALQEHKTAALDFLTGDALACLTSIFGNLAMPGTPLSVLCSSRELHLDGNRPVGYKRLQAFLENGDEDCIDENGGDRLAFDTIRSALLHSGLRVTDLELGCPTSPLGLNHYGVDGLPAVYRNLTRLQLRLNVEIYDEDDIGDAQRARDTRNLICALRAATVLADLRIDMCDHTYYTSSHSGIFAAIAKARTHWAIMPVLARLYLKAHTVPLPVLLEFLSSYSYMQLKEVTLLQLRDGTLDNDLYLNPLHTRIEKALGIPEELSGREVSKPETNYFEVRRGDQEFVLVNWDSYTGSQGVDWDVANSRPRIYYRSQPTWPRPWPELVIEDERSHETTTTIA